MWGILVIDGAVSQKTPIEGDRDAMDLATLDLPAVKAEVVRTLDAARAARHARDAILVVRILLL